MSRHRIVRDLDYDDYEEDEDDYYDEAYGQSPVASAMSPGSAAYLANPLYNNLSSFISTQQPPKTDSMREAIDRVLEIVGDIDRAEIRIAIEQCNFDVDAATAMLLGAANEARAPVFDESVLTGAHDLAPSEEAKEPGQAIIELPSFRELPEPAVETVPHTSQPVSLLGEALSASLDPRKPVTSIPPAVTDKGVEAAASSITPFQFKEPSPDEKARSSQLRAKHSAPKRVETTGDDGKDKEILVGKPAAAPVKGLGEAALRKRRERIEKIVASQEAESRPNVNMIAGGHVDAGKSTLMGHLLYLTGAVSSKDMHRFEKESREQGKASFMFAWVLDVADDERSRGVTVDVAVNVFSTEHRRVTLLDAPGHRDFVPNMLAAASQADCALLVVDSVTGEFEAGFKDDGQTKEHAILLKSMGINEVVVVVNKLDMMGWLQARYDEIVGLVTPFLKSIGFKPNSVRFVPCSGLLGENLTKPASAPELTSWYKGPHLLQMIDEFSVPVRQLEMPMRMSCSDVFKSQALGGLAVAGIVQTGCVIVQDRVLLLPANQVVTVKAILRNGTDAVEYAVPGERIEIGISGCSDEAVVMMGSILCDVNSPLQMTSKIQATIVTLESMSRPVLAGSEMVLHAQYFEEPCIITRLRAQLHKTTGAVLKRHPRLLTSAMRASVVIEMQRPIGLEPLDVSRQLGRFTLRRDGKTTAIGIVNKVYPPSS